MSVRTAKWNEHNMMFAANTVSSKIVKRSEAEEIFRPWWDMVNDAVVGALFSLGNKLTTQKMSQQNALPALEPIITNSWINSINSPALPRVGYSWELAIHPSKSLKLIFTAKCQTNFWNQIETLQPLGRVNVIQISTLKSGNWLSWYHIWFGNYEFIVKETMFWDALYPSSSILFIDQ